MPPCLPGRRGLRLWLAALLFPPLVLSFGEQLPTDRLPVRSTHPSFIRGCQPRHLQTTPVTPLLLSEQICSNLTAHRNQGCESPTVWSSCGPSVERSAYFRFSAPAPSSHFPCVTRSSSAPNGETLQPWRTKDVVSCGHRIRPSGIEVHILLRCGSRWTFGESIDLIIFTLSAYVAGNDSFPTVFPTLHRSVGLSPVTHRPAVCCRSNFTGFHRGCN